MNHVELDCGARHDARVAERLRARKHGKERSRKDPVVQGHGVAVLAPTRTGHDSWGSKYCVRLARPGLAVAHDVDVDAFEEGINAAR